MIHDCTASATEALGVARGARAGRPRSPRELLLGAFVDLSPTPIGSLQTLSIEACFAEMASDEDDPLPVQSHPSGQFRARILGDLGLQDHMCRNPNELPDELRTERWLQLVEWTDGFADLSVGCWRKLVVLCQSMGMYHAVADLAGAMLRHRYPGGADPLVDPLSAWLSQRLAKAERTVTGTPEARGREAETLRAVADASGLPTSLRLTAALTLIVSCSKGRERDPAAAAHWRAKAERLHSALDLEGWRSTALSSVYWRAVSFIPFQCGDKLGVVREIGLAEQYALELPQETMGQRVVRGQYLHPLNETSAKVALWMGDRDLALERAAGLVAVDPYEPKAHVQLGDLYMKFGEPTAAVPHYRRATLLGPPYTAVAWFKLGRALESSGDLEGALPAYVQALQSSSGASAFAASASRVAERVGDPTMRHWLRQVDQAPRAAEAAR